VLFIVLRNWLQAYSLNFTVVEMNSLATICFFDNFFRFTFWSTIGSIYGSITGTSAGNWHFRKLFWNSSGTFAGTSAGTSVGTFCCFVFHYFYDSMISKMFF
jgi:hypothetical protein